MPGRHEMGADGDIRAELAHEFHQRPGAEPIQPQPHEIGLPRLVAAFVNPAEHLRGAADELHVELRVEIAEELVREDERILVLHGIHAGILGEGFRQRLGGFYMPGAGAGGEDQDALFHLSDFNSDP